MGLIQNKELLVKLQEYLQNTNFGNQSLGHNLTLSFVPKAIKKKVEDKRYTFKLKHRLFSEAKEFNKVTYSEIIVGVILELTEEIKNISDEILSIYEQTGLIEDKKCTKELIGTVVSNCLALNPSFQIGNTVTQVKHSDNLQIIFPEFKSKSIDVFLSNLDKYKPTI